MSMTENEAKYIIIEHRPFVANKELNDAVNMAIQALEEIQQIKEIVADFPLDCGNTVNDVKEIWNQLSKYLKIDTVEDFKALKEKSEPKKVKKQEHKILIAEGWKYGCPSCGCGIGENERYSEYTQQDDYCPTCGQKLDFGKEE